MSGAEARKCSNCGAAVARAAARFCEYCGHELPRPPAPPPVPPAGPYGDVEARFAALQQHADLARLMALTPALPALGCAPFLMVGFFVLFIGAALTIFGGVASMEGPSFLLFVPGMFVVFGVAMGFSVLKRTLSFRNSPLRREPAMVVGGRTEISGGGRDSSASTTYYVGLELPGGQRVEYEAMGELYGRLADGDVGVAYLKGHALVDFQRLRV